MELFSEEVHKIKGLLEEWQSHPEVEVEATFGFKGQVDMQTFLRVVNRLRSKGYEAISQMDRLTISLTDNQPFAIGAAQTVGSFNHMRFTLTGSGHITQYCRDNRIDNKPFVAIIKDANIPLEKKEQATIDIKEYDVRVKGRREVELGAEDPLVKYAIQGWGRLKKYFRIIRRWTFTSPGLKFDLSMVRSTPRGRVDTTFNQSIVNQRPIYEIEVELDRTTMPKDFTHDDGLKSLVKGMGDVLRGIQGNQILTRKSTKESALRAYKELAKTERFRGVGLVTLQVKHMTAEAGEAPNIRSGYNVTDKADGLRVHGFTDKHGELFMIDMALNVYRTGLVMPLCKDSLLDGEYITADKNGNAIQQLLFFDIYYRDGEDVSVLPFKGGRHEELQQWFAPWEVKENVRKTVKGSSLVIGLKRFFFGDVGDTSIFDKARDVLRQDEIRPYHTDGLIFTPNDEPLPKAPGITWYSQFKWKPAEENTIDFLVSTVKEEENPEMDKVEFTIHPGTGETIRYKTYQLFVGSYDNAALKDPRATILNLLPLPEDVIGDKDKREKYHPIPFVPLEYPEMLANICHVKVESDDNPDAIVDYCVTEKTNEPMSDRSVIEMRYDMTQPSGWRWIPTRVRADKSERFLKGQILGSLNKDSTAQDNWISIHQPVTKYMISTGSETPSDAEVAEFQLPTSKPMAKKYYERKAPLVDQRKVEALHEFHNLYIKDTILYSAIATNTPNPSLLDVAVGRGNDLHRWRRIGASFVLGVDATGECCLNRENGAYARLLNTMVRARTHKAPLPIPPMFFVIGDSSRRLLDGSAGENQEEGDMLRAILGRVPPQGVVPPAITKYGQSALSMGANAITCMYAIHYFFENAEKLNGLLQNIADNLQIGGYFVGTNFDGKAVFDLLRGVEVGKSRVGLEGDTILWEIKKRYDAAELPIDDTAFGMEIDVEFISIGMSHKEYLVPWELLVAKMKTIGCELLDVEELVKLGLNNSSNMYDESFAMAMKSKDRSKFKMNEVAKQFSFLNRWYIFKRTSQGAGTIGKILDPATIRAVAEEAAEAANVEGDLVAEAAASAAVKTLHADAEEFVPGGITTREDLATLAQQIAQSPTQTQLMASMAPATGLAAAIELQKQITAAEAAKDRAQLAQLDEQAAMIRATLQTAQGITQTVPQLATGGPAGAVAKSFVKDYLGARALTVPVEARTAVGTQKYKLEQVFQFNERSTKVVRYLDLPDKYKSYAARHLAPNAPFRIRDLQDSADDTEYPSITHFMAAMRFKYASKKPELAANYFGEQGRIHQAWLVERMKEAKKSKTGMLKIEQQNELLEKETAEVETEMERLKGLRETGYDSGIWATIKYKLLEEAIRQRLAADKWFCVIVSAALAQGKYLLYHDEQPNSELGGSRVIRSGLIQGQNKYGNLILQLAQEMPEELKVCLALPDPA